MLKTFCFYSLLLQSRLNSNCNNIERIANDCIFWSTHSYIPFLFLSSISQFLNIKHMKNNQPIYHVLRALMLALTCLFYSQVNAQQATVSKTEFITLANKLNAAINENRMDDAQKKWEEIHTLMKTEFINGETKMDEAGKGNSTGEKKRITDEMTSKAALYSEIVVLHTNMTANKSKLQEKLNSFAETIR